MNDMKTELEIPLAKDSRQIAKAVNYNTESHKDEKQLLILIAGIKKNSANGGFELETIFKIRPNVQSTLINHGYVINKIDEGNLVLWY